MAISRAEASKEREADRNASAMFLKAIDPSQARRRELAGEPAAAAPPPPAAAVPPVAAAPPAGPPPRRPSRPRPPLRRRPPPSPPPRSTSRNAAAGYPGDNASQEQLAKWLAKQAEAAGLPPELPVMASLVESGVKNLNFGDADSVGFFQMRVGIWDQGAYKGFAAEARAAGQVVHRQRARRQAQGDRPRRRRLRQGPGEVGRVDRRHRAPRRAVPRPLPAAARRGAQAPRRSARRRRCALAGDRCGHRRSAWLRVSPRRRRRGRSSPPPPLRLLLRRRRRCSSAARCCSSAA